MIVDSLITVKQMNANNYVFKISFILDKHLAQPNEIICQNYGYTEFRNIQRIRCENVILFK